MKDRYLEHFLWNWWMPQNLTDDKSTLLQIMAWCSHSTSRYLNQCYQVLWRHMASLGHGELKDLGVLLCLKRKLNTYFNTGHDDVIKWKHVPRKWPFVRGIHWSPVNLVFSLLCAWTTSTSNFKRLYSTQIYKGKAKNACYIVMHGDFY